MWSVDERDPFVGPEGGESVADVASRLVAALLAIEAAIQGYSFTCLFFLFLDVFLTFACILMNMNASLVTKTQMNFWVQRIYSLLIFLHNGNQIANSPSSCQSFLKNLLSIFLYSSNFYN